MSPEQPRQRTRSNAPDELSGALLEDSSYSTRCVNEVVIASCAASGIIGALPRERGRHHAREGSFLSPKGSTTTPSMIESFSFKKTALFLLLTATAFFQVADVSAQIADRESLIWEAIAEENIAARGPRYLEPEKYRTFRLDQNELVNVLNSAPLEFSDQSKGSPVTLSVPTPDGTLVQFRLEESPILAPHIASQFPGWKTYQGHGIDDPRVTARFSWTDRGFHGYVLDPSGTYSIEPYQANDNVNYIVFRKSRHEMKSELIYFESFFSFYISVMFLGHGD